MRFDTSESGLRRDTDVEFFTAGGPGGQHRNKTESGVRLHHRPSGLRVMATERRSQYENLRVGFERLTARLERLNRPPRPRVATKPTRSSKRRRLDSKAHLGERKKSRRRVDVD